MALTKPFGSYGVMPGVIGNYAGTVFSPSYPAVPRDDIVVPLEALEDIEVFHQAMKNLAVQGHTYVSSVNASVGEVRLSVAAHPVKIVADGSGNWMTEPSPYPPGVMEFVPDAITYPSGPTDEQIAENVRQVFEQVNGLPDTTAQEEAPMVNNRVPVAFDVTTADGNTETIEAITVSASAAVVSFYDEGGSIATYNLNSVVKYVPVYAEDRPALVTGIYTFEIAFLDGSETVTVTADRNAQEGGGAEDGSLNTLVFSTRLPNNTYREELRVKANLVKSVTRVEETPADSGSGEKGTASSATV